jgi:hypothetical protein
MTFMVTAVMFVMVRIIHRRRRSGRLRAEYKKEDTETGALSNAVIAIFLFILFFL